MFTRPWSAEQGESVIQRLQARLTTGLRLAPWLAFTLMGLTACGGTSTTVTRTGNTTQTVTQSDTVQIALITASTAVLSALLTGLVAHVTAARRERSQATRDQATATDRLVRESVASVSTALGQVMAIAHRVSGEAANAGAYQAAHIYDDGYREVQACRDTALPQVYLIEDEDLRAKAIEVFDLYGGWLSGSSEAMVNQVAQPPVEPAWDARDAYFARARAVLAESGASVAATSS